VQTWNQQQFCAELDRVKTRFTQLTGSSLAPIWRAPGGRTTPAALQWAKACGYAHVGWSPAGFLGDELSSTTHPNKMLLERAVKNIKDGDVLMMHTGIWSRKDAFAPMLDPLLTALKAKQLCFATVGDGGY
jgi:peptidoglycan-N-acetylmuramic acid deacetylase